MLNKLLNYTKKAAVVFVVIVFVMGFFSKTIINIFLPKVITQTVMEGKVERTLNIEGIVEAERTIGIRLENAAIVDEFFVQPGDVILKGTPVFRVNRELHAVSTVDTISELRQQLELEKLKLGLLVSTENISVLNTIVSDEEELKALKQRELLILELRHGIERRENSIAKLLIEQKYYSRISSDGIYYAEISGVVANINESERLINGGEAIVNIAEIGEEAGYKLIVQIDEADYAFAASTGKIEVKLDKKKPLQHISISRISSIAKNHMLEIEAKLQGDINRDFKLGQRITGRIKKQYSVDNMIVIPKSAIVPSGGFIEGSKGSVFLIEKNEGILGTEYVSREAEVEILVNGDSEVIVSGLESYESTRVIINPSYKISDGTKVLPWR